jgi:chromate transporter
MEVAGLFLRLGVTAFGGPAAHIALMREEVVRRRRWVSDERFMDLVGVANLVPGPTSTEVAIYLGYLRAGWSGLLLGGLCFIGPAMILVLGLAWAYSTYGALPQVGRLFYGIQPVVVAIIAQAAWNLRRAVLKTPWAVALALVALGLYLAGVNILALLVAGGLVVATANWAARRRRGKLPTLGMALHFSFSKWPLSIGALGLATVPFSQGLLFLTFLKVGAVIYGSGYVLLAFLRADLVQGLGWLTDRQLLDAIAVGQFTPGPVFTTATFIGYLLGGWLGAIVATVGIFLPSFVFIALAHPLADRIRRSPLTAPLLDGVNIVALALICGVLVQLSVGALVDWLTWGLTLLSFAVLLRFKINSVWLILAGAAVGLIMGSG